MEKEVTEAMDTLASLGQGDEAQEVLRDAVQNVQARYASISADTMISEDYRRQLLAQTWQKQADDLTTRLTAMADQARAGDTLDASSVFGVRGLPGDFAQLTMSRRDAADRVKGILRPDELMRELNSATRSGDEIMARAVAEQATAIGAADVVNAFTAARPALADTVERVWNSTHRRADFNSRFVTAGYISNMKPPGFERAYETEISRRARGE